MSIALEDLHGVQRSIQINPAPVVYRECNRRSHRFRVNAGTEMPCQIENLNATVLPVQDKQLLTSNHHIGWRRELICAAATGSSANLRQDVAVSIEHDHYISWRVGNVDVSGRLVHRDSSGLLEQPLPFPVADIPEKLAVRLVNQDHPKLRVSDVQLIVPIDGQAGRRLHALAGATRNTRVSAPGKIENVYCATIGDDNAAIGIGRYLRGPRKPFVGAKIADAKNHINRTLTTRRRRFPDDFGKQDRVPSH